MKIDQMSRDEVEAMCLLMYQSLFAINLLLNTRKFTEVGQITRKTLDHAGKMYDE